jgi:hypothetical protein
MAPPSEKILFGLDTADMNINLSKLNYHDVLHTPETFQSACSWQQIIYGCEN